MIFAPGRARLNTTGVFTVADFTAADYEADHYAKHRHFIPLEFAGRFFRCLCVALMSRIARVNCLPSSSPSSRMPRRSPSTLSCSGPPGKITPIRKGLADWPGAEAAIVSNERKTERSCNLSFLATRTSHRPLRTPRIVPAHSERRHKPASGATNVPS